MKRIPIGRFASFMACCLAFSQASIFAQEAVAPASSLAPAGADKKAEVDPKLQPLLDNMGKAIQKSRATKNTESISAVIAEAAKSGVSDVDVGSVVAMAVRAYPEQVGSFVQTAIVASGGSKASASRVLSVMKSAVDASPRPFAAIVAVRDSAIQAVGDSPVLVAHVKEGSIAMAEYASDNPLSPVSVETTTESSTPAATPTHSITTDAGGTLLLQIDGVPTIPPPLLPASPSDGAR